MYIGENSPKIGCKVCIIEIITLGYYFFHKKSAFNEIQQRKYICPGSGIFFTFTDMEIESVLLRTYRS